MASDTTAGVRTRTKRSNPSLRLAPWAVSWLKVGPLASILLVLFALPTLLFFVVSFFDYDRVGIYPAFMLDNYRDLLTTPATLRIYVSSLKFAVVVWAITLLIGFSVAHFLVFHVRSGTVRAARDAGASRWHVMRHVILPLSRTGIVLGSVLVSTQVMGDYFVVKRMSGGQSASIVSALSTEIQAMQYPPASANAVVLVLVVALLVAAMMRVVDVRRELVG